LAWYFFDCLIFQRFGKTDEAYKQLQNVLLLHYAIVIILARRNIPAKNQQHGQRTVLNSSIKTGVLSTINI